MNIFLVKDKFGRLIRSTVDSDYLLARTGEGIYSVLSRKNQKTIFTGAKSQMVNFGFVF